MYVDKNMNPLPGKPHPIVNAFTQHLNNNCNSSSTPSKQNQQHQRQRPQSKHLQKVSQVLGWRNRFSQSEYYPVELSLSQCTTSGLDKESVFVASASFEVKQIQRGEVENTYGTGATVWPASMVLIKFLEHLVNSKHGNEKDRTILWNNHETETPSLNICDLGAGTGVTSIAAAMLFHRSTVVCTDGDENVVELCRANIENAAKGTKRCASASDGNVNANENENESNDSVDAGNATSTSTCSKRFMVGNNDSSVEVMKYWWGNKDDEARVLEKASPPFDIVLISDCVLPKLYPIAPLVDALDKCMSTRTVAYCTYEHRYYEPYNPKQHFIDLCHEKSLEVKQIPTEDQHPIYSVDDIEVWQITRK